MQRNCLPQVGGCKQTSPYPNPTFDLNVGVGDKTARRSAKDSEVFIQDANEAILADEGPTKDTDLSESIGSSSDSRFIARQRWLWAFGRVCQLIRRRKRKQFEIMNQRATDRYQHAVVVGMYLHIYLCAKMSVLLEHLPAYCGWKQRSSGQETGINESLEGGRPGESTHLPNHPSKASYSLDRLSSSRYQ